jgi:Family of unknown function (DUF6343)
MRSGDEPSHARSPLRMRLVLATFGLVCWSAGAVTFTLVHAGVLAVSCMIGACVAAVNIAVVAHRIRSGPHWQPGPLIPPYRPLEPAEPRIRQARPRVPHDVRVRRYLWLMGTALLLVVLSWGWLWRVSMPVAMGMSLLAMFILPIAAIVANAGSFAPRDSTGDPVRVGPPSRHP